VLPERQCCRGFSFVDPAGQSIVMGTTGGRINLPAQFRILRWLLFPAALSIAQAVFLGYAFWGRSPYRPEMTVHEKAGDGIRKENNAGPS
jgi:hypothetical protein